MPLSAVNLPTILTASVIAVIFAAIVIRGILRRRRGERGCGCGCSGCPNSALCHGSGGASHPHASKSQNK